ncbi:MAG: phosphoglycerate kinase [Candidatus Kaiserbacteria bacterium]|nr:phosphoglycerate kinase [Candidatus Kaiserbacteria bacterium]MCB9816600.1 phosphoglycerate kinase [Candidatus Nomurabacteria bacterium]
MKDITKAGDLRGKYVLLRSSLNIPLKDGKVQNHVRLERALPTMRYLKEHGAKTIMIAHIGRDPEETLKPVFDEMQRYQSVHWGGDVLGDEFKERRELMAEGDILLAENIRQHEGETENDAAFVEQLAALADIYVNDAFAAAHREHASTYGVALKLPAYAGLTFVEEVDHLRKVLDPAAPALFILGGAKFDTKMPLVEKFLDIYEHVFIGGALANDILKAQGHEVGQSMVSEVSLVDSPIVTNKKLLAPIDVVVDGSEGRAVKRPDQVTKEEKILDVGPMTIDMLATYIEKAETILWNGPLGAYELGYTQATEITARHIAGAEGYSVIGGGDTVAAVEKLQINECFGFVSIAGGAMLAFLEHGSTSVVDLFLE